MPVNLLIRDVPDEVRDALAERASERGQSMQVYLHQLVSSEARRSANLQLLAAVRELGGGGDEAVVGGAAEILRDLREEREARLSGGPFPS